MTFELGDIVQLKSGGPAMTVKEIGKLPYSDDEGIWCIWFERAGARQELKQEAFAPVTLMKLDEGNANVRTHRV